MQTRYVVDTTVIVSWLQDPDKLTGRIVQSLELELFTPYLAVGELWKDLAGDRSKAALLIHWSVY